MLRFAVGLAAVIVALDQVSKWVIRELVMQPPRAIEVTPFFNLVITYNRGVSFGMFSGEETWKPWALIVLSLVIVGALLWWLRRAPSRTLALAVGLICGGALGNVIDRVYLPGVVDFLDFHWGSWHWPAFNIADSAITIGVAIVVLDGLFAGRDKAK